MPPKFTRGVAVSGLIWTFLERCGNQGVHFVVSVILARLLMPSVFGTVAIIHVFTDLFGIFVNSGFSSALIQKKDADDLDYSSVFYFNLVSGVVIYILMYFIAPLIASYYNETTLITYIRVYSLVLIIGSLKSVQQVYIRKHYMFQKFFWATLVGTLMAAVLGIWMAYHGYGPWALIAQTMLNLAVDTAILWFTVNWHPKWMFSMKRLSALFDYGWKILVTGLLDSFYGKLRTLMIGKYYSRDELAFYHKGLALPQLVILNINSSINSVLFPSMSAMQNDLEAVRAYVRRAIRSSTYIIMPIMALLAASGDSVIRILLTEKWISSLFFLRIACFTYAFYPIHSANLCAIKSLGRSDIVVKLEIIKKAIGLILLFSTLWISVKAVALTAIISSILSQLINSYPNRKLLNYSYISQFQDMLPQILLSSVMGLIVYSVNLFHLNPWLTFGLQLPLGFIIYIAGSICFHLESYDYSLGFAKSALAKFMNKIKGKK